MAETDTGVAQGGLGKIIGDAVIAFNRTNVMLPLVTQKQAVKGAITVGFPDYTKIASSSVAEATDGGDHSTVTSVTTAARNCRLNSISNWFCFNPISSRNSTCFISYIWFYEIIKSSRCTISIQLGFITKTSMGAKRVAGIIT